MKIYDLISKDQITDIVNLDINSELTLEERADVKRLVFRTQDLMADNQAVLVTEEEKGEKVPFVKVKDRRLALAHAYTYLGTDFLIYGLSKEWYLSHPEIMTMTRKEMLTLMADDGALVVQAHPYREAGYIECIRLFPRHVHAVEVFNCGNPGLPNELAEIYANAYCLHKSAGSDNHNSRYAKMLAGLEFDTPLESIDDFINRMKHCDGKCFVIENPLNTKGNL